VIEAAEVGVGVEIESPERVEDNQASQRLIRGLRTKKVKEDFL